MRKESNDAKLYLSSIPRVRLKWVWLQAEQSKVWSRLSSHFQPFLFLIAHILTIFDKKCILWPSLAHYCSLISRRQPLIGSQGPCSALIADATMTHFIPLWLQDWHPPPSELSAGGVKRDVEKTQKCIHLNCNKAQRSTPGRAVQRPVMV